MELILALSAVAALTIPVCCQETAEEWLEKGIDLFAKGKYEEAIQAYDEANRLDTELAVAWNNKGIALVMQGRYEEAIQAYNEAIRLEPEDASAWNNKGKALMMLKKYGEAEVAFTTGAELLAGGGAPVAANEQSTEQWSVPAAPFPRGAQAISLQPPEGAQRSSAL